MSEQLSQQQYKRGIQYKRGDSTLAASGERFRDFSQSVGPQILTWIVIKINSCLINELTTRVDIVAADYRKTASV